MNTHDLVKLAAQALGEDHWWEFADRLLDEVPIADAGAPASGKSRARDGSFELLADLSVEIEKDTGHRFGVNALRDVRATAASWPPGERDHDVEFEVHRRLRSPKAKRQLAMYKRRAKADYKRAPGYQGSLRLTAHRLRVYKQDEKPMVPAVMMMADAAKRVANKALSLAELGAWEQAFTAAFNKRRSELDGA